MELRDYQLKAIFDVRNAWATGYRRPCVVMPCGAGKSVLVADIARRTTEKKNRVQFLVHRQELCEQIYSTFYNYGVDMRYKPDKRAVIIDHVGNVHRFGLPDQEFEWSLSPEKPKKQKEKTDEDLDIRQCPKCFSTHRYAEICPVCGYKYPEKPKEERKIFLDKNTELERITETVRHYTMPSECKSRKELVAFCKMKGYKPGWVYYAAKENHIR